MAAVVEKARMLLVEGSDEVAFFGALAAHLKLEDRLQVASYDGKDKLHEKLSVVRNDPNFEDLSAIGIVRDADYNTNAFQSVCSQIQKANRQNLVPARAFAVPGRALEFVGETPKLAVMIIPGDGIDGMLEDVILNALQDAPTMKCVMAFFDCIQIEGIVIEPTSLPKARMRVFLAAKAVESSQSARERDVWWMSSMYRSFWWSWEKPAFEPMKQFLRKVAEA